MLIRIQPEPFDLAALLAGFGAGAGAASAIETPKWPASAASPPLNPCETLRIFHWPLRL